MTHPIVPHVPRWLPLTWLGLFTLVTATIAVIALAWSVGACVARTHRVTRAVVALEER